MDNHIKRDLDLDFLRAFGIIWVILIHTLYWPSLVDQSIGLSLLLIEMPLIFFLIGASNIYAKKRTLRDFYYRRIMRILKPYELYAISVIIFSLITSKVVSDVSTGEFIMSWINPFGKHHSEFPFLSWHTWFINIYFIIIIVLPLFLKVHEHGFSKVLLIGFPALLFVLNTVSNVNENISIKNHIIYLLFYGFWTILGFYFIEIKNLRKSKDYIVPIYVVILATLLSIFFIYVNNIFGFKDIGFNMQIEKFPPTFIFFCYSLLSMLLIILFSPYIIKGMQNLCKNNFFEIIINSYVKNGFTIYLFHPFVFILIYNLLIDYITESNKIYFLILFLLVTIILSALLGILVDTLEQSIKKKIKIIINKIK